MGWSFRKSIKIAPGIRLNLSKSGLGLSGGVRGFRIGTGPRGPYINAGRDGIYYRKQLGSRSAGGAGRSGALGWIVLLVIIGIAVAMWLMKH